jgi:RHS repeat-associated protein
MGLVLLLIAPGMRSRRRSFWTGSGRRRGGPRIILGSLLGLLLLAVVSPTSASAAECTNTWTGPAEGGWGTAANWSAGKVPGENDVACIGSGKTVKMTGAGTRIVEGLQGEGTLSMRESTLELLGTAEAWQIGTLKLDYKGLLTGAGTLEITKGLSWESQSTMSGTGMTVLGSKAVSTIGSANSDFTLSGRKLVNEGTITQLTYSRLAMAEGGVFENLGTYNANGEKSSTQMSNSGVGSIFVNKGTFRKTEGTSIFKASSDFENFGTLSAETGKIRFQGAGTSAVFADESVIEGAVSGEIGSAFTFNTLASPKANLYFREAQINVPAGESASVGNLTLDYEGNISGPGTLAISQSLIWGSTSTMSGKGTTRIEPSATGTVTTYGAYLKERALVNEGTFNLQGIGRITASEGAVLENNATFNANTVGEYARFPGVYTGSGLIPPKVINNETIQRTLGTDDTRLNINVENLGTINIETGRMLFNQTGSTVFLAPESTLEGSTRFEKSGIIGDDFKVPNGTLSVRESPVTFEGKDTSIANLRIDYGTTVTGSGDLEVTQSFVWGGQSTFSGTGKVTLKPGTTNLLDSGATEVTLGQRELINEGNFTHIAHSKLKEAAGAIIRNKGTYTISSQPYPLWVADIIRSEGGPAANKFVNEGLFQRVEGSTGVQVIPGFENHGVIKEQSSKVEIKNPITVAKTEQFGKRSNCGDPVECATGNFYETQTDFAIGGLGIGVYLTRTYSAQAAAAATSPGMFGYGWTHSFSDVLVVEGGGEKVTLTQSNGSTIPFTKVSGSNYAAPPWSQDTLSGSPEAGYTVIRTDQTQLDFSGTGRLESVVDRSGNETTLTYDEAGRLKTIEDPAGRQITFTYNAGGQVESAEDPMGNVVKYAYESKHLKSVTLPGEEGARWQFKYDGSHRMTTMTDGRGGKTTNEYDASSRVKSQTDPGGHTLTFEYASFHTKVTNKATGAVTDQWFTSNNQPYSITRGFGTADATTETFSYNIAGQLVGATDGNGHKTTYGYDAEGNRTSEKDAEGNETKWTYNETHDVISMTTPGGETTTIERDANGNPETVSRPAPEEAVQTTTYVYDPNGQVESVTDSMNETWSFAYDAEGNRISETDPAGNTRTWEYDENARPTATVAPRGNEEGAEPAEYETTTKLDVQGRPEVVTDPLGETTEFEYDGNGNLISRTDANGNATKFAYDPMNQRTKVERPSGIVTEIGYDGAGFITSKTDGNEETTTYVRNALGQAVEVIDPLSRKTLVEFDGAGNVESVADPAERVTSYSYDDANRLLKASYSDGTTPTAEFEYDADSNVTRMVDGTGETSYDYDVLGQLEESENGHGDVVGYDHDLAGRVTEIVYPNGKSVLREFDNVGRLESITDWLGGTTTFAYDADSNLKQTAFPASTGNVDSYSYDRAGRMSEVTYSDGMEALASLSYGREKVGQVDEMSSVGLPGPAEMAFGYDKDDRLTEAGEAGFGYDDADNLTEGMGSTNAYDAASQLETGTGVSYAFDQIGARIEADPASGPATTYGYDQAGNLLSVDRPEEGEVAGMDKGFAYDGAGLLASETNGLGTSYLTWDVSEELPLILHDGVYSYIYGPGGLPIAQISGEEAPTYLHHDQIGSTRLLTGATGAATATFTYGPYGQLEGQTGSATTRLGFAGQLTDPETGLQYLRARFYDPATAQFLSRDPLADLTNSPYGYADANPLRYVDPSGMACVGAGPSGLPIPVAINPVDCLGDALGKGAEEADDVISNHGQQLLPIGTAAVCVLAPEACGAVGAAALALGLGLNFLKERNDPCFGLINAQLQQLLVTAAAALPGGVFGATAGKTTIGPIARRILQVVLNAPGVALEVVHAGARP